MVFKVNKDKLKARVDGLRQIEIVLGSSVDLVIENYSKDKFRDSNILKARLFQECIELELSTPIEAFISDRCRLGFHKDMRSSVEYGMELVFGWISEDLIFSALRARGFDVKLNGTDKSREFLKQSEIGTDPDYSVSRNGLERRLELMFSWSNYWTLKNKWDLRESKYEKMIVAGNEILCLGIELPICKSFVIDMAIYGNRFYKRNNPAWGGKASFTYEGIKNELTDLNEAFLNLGTLIEQGQN
jgi:hypothetical protein